MSVSRPLTGLGLDDQAEHSHSIYDNTASWFPGFAANQIIIEVFRFSRRDHTTLVDDSTAISPATLYRVSRHLCQWSCALTTHPHRSALLLPPEFTGR